MPFEDLGYSQFSECGCGPGCRRTFEQLQSPIGIEISLELKKRRKIADKLLAQATHVAASIASVLLMHARPLPQLDKRRIACGQPAKAMPVGTQCRGHHIAIAAVVLGASDREPVAKPVDLFGVNRMHAEPALNQGVNDRAMRYLDSNKDCIRRAVGGGDEPVRHARKPLTAVLDLQPAKPLALVVGDDNIMLLTRPIYGGVPTPWLNAHSCLQDQTHAPRACLRSRLFLYWRSQLGTAGRGLPTGCRSQPIRRAHKSETGARGTGCRECFHGESARSRQDAPVGARDHSCFVSLRFTPKNDRETCPQTAPARYRMPARSLSLPHAPRPLGRRSKAASERNRGIGAALSAGVMGIWLAQPAQLWCCEMGVGSDC